MRSVITIIVFLPFLILLCSPPKSDRIVEREKIRLYYIGFTVQYNPNNRQPDWVEYTLTAEQVRATEHIPEIKHKFMPDPNTSIPQASNEDYKDIHGQYSLTKGHMARHMDMKFSTQAALESDYYTNICPQHEKLNNGIWKRIENKVRKIAIEYDSVRIVCGPIFINNANGYIGPNRIPVPDSFFKTLLVKDGSGYHAIAFLCPNNDNPISMKEAVCTVDRVESLSKIDVYSYLPNKIESFVEKHIEPAVWSVK